MNKESPLPEFTLLYSRMWSRQITQMSKGESGIRILCTSNKETSHRRLIFSIGLGDKIGRGEPWGPGWLVPHPRW